MLHLIIAIHLLSLALTNATSLDCPLILLQNNEHSDFLLQKENYTIWLQEQNKHTLSLYERYTAGEGEALLHRVDAGLNGQDIEFLSGFPKSVKLITVADEIYRHYSPDYSNVIREEKVLRAGSRPFILPEPHLRKEYVELTGIFVTDPTLDPKNLWLGYDVKTPHVDFKLPKGLIILDFGDGNFLIPGPPKVVEWMAKKYQEYKIHNKLDPLYQFNFSVIDRRGGLKLPLVVPIILYEK